MPSEASRSGVVLEMAEEFLERYRHGERPSLKEYIDRRPDLAAEIREVFPAMAMMERIAIAEESLAGPAAPGASRGADAVPLTRLGDYRIIREVGRGGMGVVYEAEQVSLGRHVALKVLPQRLLSDQRSKRRFEREAKAAAKLHHTNIVPVFGVGEHEGVPYYVMQFIQGQGLDKVLDELRRLRAGPPCDALTVAEDGSAAAVAGSLLARSFAGADLSPPGLSAETPAPAAGSSSSAVLPGRSASTTKRSAKPLTYWQSVASLGAQVADALSHAHQQGVSHRDIKPSNLLVDAQGTAWVTDFGLAKTEEGEDLTDTGDVLGTLRYVPPEAFDGRADWRGDVYSLGLTLYELLAFRPAFDQQDRAQLVKRVTTGEPTRLKAVNPGVPRDLDTIVHKAIERDPAHRYATASDLAADLQRFLDDEPIQARRAAAVERLSRWARRNKAVAAALAAVALLLLVIATGSLAAAAHFMSQEDTQRKLAEQNLNLAGEKDQERGKAIEAKNSADAARALAERNEAERRRDLYFAQMNLAGQAAVSPGGLGRVGELLANWRGGRPDLRHWEWYYLNGLCRRDLLTLRGHAAGVGGVDWSPDGARLASSALDGTVRVWEAATLLRAASGGGEPPPCATLRVWDDAGPKVHPVHSQEWWVTSVAWSPDRQRLAVCCADGLVRVWSPEGGRVLFAVQGEVSAAWSRDGTRLATCGDATVWVWDAASGKKLLAVTLPDGYIRSVVWSPDGTRLAGARFLRTVKVWDAKTGDEVASLGEHPGAVMAVAWEAGGPRIASGSNDGTITVWDLDTRKKLGAFRGHTAPVRSLAWAPGGLRLASAGDDGMVKVWDAEGKPQASLRGHAGAAWAVAWSPDSQRLASAGDDGTVKLWDPNAGPELPSLRGHAGAVVSLSWGPGDEKLASVALPASVGQNGVVKAWNVPVSREAFALESRGLQIHAAAWSPDGKHLAAALDDGTVEVRDAGTGQDHQVLRGHIQSVYGLAWSPDGRQLASAGRDGTVRVWDVESGQERHTLGKSLQALHAIAWSPDGQWLASAGADGTAALWDAVSGRGACSWPAHGAAVRSLAWSPDGRWLASAGDDRSIKLWNRAGQGVLTLRGHAGAVSSVAWCPDSQRLASASRDQTVKVWEPTTGQEVLTLRSHTDWVRAVAWSPDGRRLASGGVDKAILIHDATAGYRAEGTPGPRPAEVPGP